MDLPGKQLIIRVVYAAIITMILSAPLAAEYVFLKDGSIVKCKVTDENAAAVTVADKNGAPRVFGRGNILRVIYKEMDLSKVFIRMIDGRVLEGYIVDESRTAYTFRKSIDRPEEVRIERTDVMFVTKSNPSGLRGSPRETAVLLNWAAPVRPPDVYNVYMKGPEGAYKLIGSTSDTEYLAKNLRKKTFYIFKVTAVDSAKTESPPTNEVQVMTNILPEAPGNTKISYNLNKEKTALGIFIKWDKASDPDGKVVEYRVYKKSDLGLTRAGATEKTEFTVTGETPGEKPKYMVLSVDDNGYESEKPGFRLLEISLQVRPSFLLPVGTFGKMHDYGYGGLAHFGMENIWLEGLNFGFETGFYYFPGKVKSVEMSYLIPFFLSAGYSWYFVKNFFIEPRLAFGGSYNVSSYDPLGATQFQPAEYQTKIQFELMFLGGLAFGFVINRKITVTAGADFAMIFEKGGNMSFVSANAGVLYHLDFEGMRI